MDLYEILGVSPNADLPEIRQHYRQLVRQYHPDVSVDKLAAHDKIVAIVNAYKTLNDPLKREAYDRARQQQTATVAAYSWEEERRRQSVDSLLTAAELYLFREQHELAIAECQNVLQRDPNNPHAYGLLGDIYRELRRYDEAITMFTYAIQLAPRSQLYQRRLDELLQMDKMRAQKAAANLTTTAAPPRETHLTLVAEKPKPPHAPAAVTIGIISLLLALASLAWVWSNPGALLLGSVPTNALIAAALDGFLLGLALPLLHWVGHVDEELFMHSDTFAGGAFPVGLLIGVLGVLSFYLSLVCYIVLALIHEQFSWSVVKMMSVTLALVLIFAALCSSIATTVLLWGGNVIFTCLLIGWSVGSMGRSRW